MNDNKFLLIAIHNVGLTKKSFAMKMGVSIQTVNKWINFGYNPSDDNLNKLLDVLQITSEEFYSQKFLDKREENKNEDVKEIVPKDELGYEVRYYSSFMKNYVSEKRMLQDFQKGKANKHVVIVYENGEEKDIAFITGDAIRTKLKFNNCTEAYSVISRLSSLLGIKVEHSDRVEKKILERMAFEISNDKQLYLDSNFIKEYESRISLGIMDVIAIKFKSFIKRIDYEINEWFGREKWKR